METLRVGSRGENVRTLQQLLPSIPPLVADGIFGPRTEAAVIAFQRQFGLVPDGIVGPLTWAKLTEVTGGGAMPPYPGTALRVGSSGASVRSIQECLNSIGRTNPSIAPLATDGVFGPRTQASVIAFQRLVGLVPDGVVGPLTWGRLREFCGGSTPPTPPPPPPPPTARVVVLDAGHGGADSGSVFGTRREKDDNLRLALAVQTLLQAQGIRVIMTRSTDTTVSLAERSAISNRNNTNLFVSIHRNASTNTAANGVENFVFTSAPDGTVLRAFDVLDELAGAGVQNNRGVIRANFAVLRNTTAPAMLLEVGFITNVRDNQLFDQNFNNYAAAIARGIVKALNSSGVPAGFFFYTVIGGDSLPAIANRFGTTSNAIMQLNKLTTSLIQIGQVLKIPRR